MIPPLSRPALASPAVLGLGDGSEDVMAALDQSEFRKVMGRFATGVTVITGRPTAACAG